MCALAWNCAPELFNLDFYSDCPADTRHFQAMIKYIVLPPRRQKIGSCPLGLFWDNCLGALRIQKNFDPAQDQ